MGKNTSAANWSMTYTPGTKYKLTCLDSNFNQQEMSVKVPCGGKVMTDDLYINVKANTAVVTVNNKTITPTPTLDAVNHRVKFTGEVTNNTTVTRGWIEGSGSSYVTNGKTSIKATGGVSDYYYTIRLADSISASAIGNASNVEIYDSDPRTSSAYLRVSANTNFSLTVGTPGWYTGGTYSGLGCSRVGEIPKEWVYTDVFVSDYREGGTGGRYEITLNPNFIYIVCNDDVDLWDKSSGNIVIWYECPSSGNTNLDGGSIIYYDRTQDSNYCGWRGLSYDKTSPTFKAQGNTASDVYGGRGLHCWVDSGKYLRPIRIRPNFTSNYSVSMLSGYQTQINIKLG